MHKRERIERVEFEELEKLVTYSVNIYSTLDQWHLNPFINSEAHEADEMDDSKDINKVNDDFITENDESTDESILRENNDNGMSLQVNITLNKFLCVYNEVLD